MPLTASTAIGQDPGLVGVRNGYRLSVEPGLERFDPRHDVRTRVVALSERATGRASLTTHLSVYIQHRDTSPETHLRAVIEELAILGVCRVEPMTSEPLVRRHV